ncbi:unnamed protein product, partial [Ectocarpus sp. 8 AP-2014]
MSLMKDAAALRMVPPFTPISAERLKLLAFAGELVSYPAGALVIEQDQHGETAFVLIEGTAGVTITKDGQPDFTAELEQYAFFGELALLRNTPRAATITAKTNIQVLKISKIALDHMIELEPEL